MKKNKTFIILSVILVVIAFAVAVLLKPAAQAPKETSDLADATKLIRPHTYIKGPADAKITLVEFFDPECEACRSMNPILEQLYNEFPGQLRIAYRYTPFHANSVYAIAVLEEARAQGKFEEALASLFENQPVWGSHHDPKPQLLPGYMEKLGLDKKLFDKDKVIAKHQAVIDADRKDGEELSVRQTPTYFVNGKRLYNIGYDFLKMAITDALKEQGK